MVFSSLQFIFFFFPIVFLGYVFIKPEIANAWLLFTSLLFYYIGASDYMPLFLGVIVLAYLSGLVLERLQNQKIRRVLLILSITVMLLLMFYYKYWNFAITNINRFFERNIQNNTVILPLGISFFIFQAISYVVDVYRGSQALLNPIDMGLYISFFPQLVAGPIVRFDNIREYLDVKYRNINLTNFSEGIWRFCIGLCKKVIIANNLGALADLVFGVRNISQYSVLYTWLGAIAYTFQIYYDFSGYSDMAIGLGRLFGFEFQENFDYPYIADSVKEFWRRWHISLSQFFRDYVYIPLGGNRCSKVRWMINMMIVWLLTGIWHGAAWNYIMWGVLYGIILVLEKNLKISNSNYIGIKVLKHVYTMFVVILLWVLFRANGLTQARTYILHMLGIGAKSFVSHDFIFLFKNYFLLLCVAVLFCLPISRTIQEKWESNRVFRMIESILLGGAVVASISYVYMGSYNPFLYFMF